jgi:glutamate transport system permease protein
VSPLAPLRAAATVYVEILRNTPLTLVFFFLVFVAPQFGILPPLGFGTAVVALSLYTSAFVCEAVRSGINSVAVGQAEAARAIGLTFGQTLGLVVLPQAVRSVIPPLINVLIALTKNTSVAAGFAVVELLATGRRLALANPADAMWALAGVAIFYLVITVPAGYLAGVLERKVAFAR